jgi:cation diffusion facilitator CzcD-associated flavoprotein CzcO
MTSTAAALEQERRDWGPRWRVVSAPVTPGGDKKTETETEVFDAVVVCNGHYSEPRVPTFPGSDTWPGLQMHSHNYRQPVPAFTGKNVVVLGAMASGEDLSREISAVASKVHLAARGYTPPVGLYKFNPVDP